MKRGDKILIEGVEMESVCEGEWREYFCTEYVYRVF